MRRLRGVRGRASIKALAAARTWHRVISGFFPPQPLGLAGQEKMADLSDRQVSHDGVVLADLEVAHAQFVLLVLQAALDGPAGEGDMQNGFERRARRGIGEEVFFLARIQDVASIDEPIRAEHLTIASQPEGRAFDFPDHRSFVGVLEIDALPGLPQHDARVAAERFDIAVHGPGFACRIAEPAVEVAADLDDIALLKRFESGEEFGTTGIPLVGREPAEVEPIGQGAANLFESDLILGSIDDPIGDAGFASALGIGPTVFGQEQVAIDHDAELGVVTGIAKMDADNAVIDLAGVAAPLALDAGGVRAALGMPRIVDDADGLGIGMIASDDPLAAVAHQGAVPTRQVHEFLERAPRRVGELGNGFNALARQVGKLAPHVTGQMPARLRAGKAVMELAQEIGELRAQRKDLFGSHPELLATALLSRS